MKHPLRIGRHAEWEVAPRDPVTIGAAILGASATAATTVAGYALGAAVVGYVATSVVSNLLIRTLSSSQKGATQENRGTLVNSRQATGAQEFVYGVVRKGGNVTFIASSGENNIYLHYIVCLAGEAVSSIGDIYVNDSVVTLSGTEVTSERWVKDGTPHMWVTKYDGTQTAPDPELDALDIVPSNFVGNGIAYLYIKMRQSAEVYSNGIPSFSAVVSGMGVYDPRTGITGPTSNAALIINDYLQADYGLNDSNVDYTYISSAANDSDDQIPLTGGGTQDRYTIDGVVNSGSEMGAVLEDMTKSCNGTLYKSGADWKLKVGVFDASVKSFTLDDLRSTISLPTKASRGQNFNEVVGRFVDADQGWVDADFPAVTNAAFLAEDNGIESTADLSLPMLTNAARAQRVAKQTLYRAREQLSFNAEFSMAAIDVSVGDTVDLTIDNYGWVNKTFEVTSWRLLVGNEGVKIAMALVETSAAAFGWTDADAKVIVSNNTNLPDYNFVPSVGVTIESELRLVNEEVVGALSIETTSSSDFAEQFEAQYRISGATRWTSLGRATDARFEAVGVTDGEFDVRGRAINAVGNVGEWTTVNNYFASLFKTAPQDVTGFSGNVMGDTVHLSWTPSPDLDLSHYKIRFSSLTSGASYQNARDFIKKVSRPANTVSVPSQTGTYFIKAIDKLGISSDFPATIVIDTDSADVYAQNFLITNVENPAWSGTKDNIILETIESDTYLRLDNLLLQEGVYDFTDELDLGAVFVTRVTTSMDIRYLQVGGDTFDETTGLFDLRAGYFDGDPSQFDTTSARTQMSVTLDDPASGSAVWSDWRDFVVGDVKARGVRLRVFFETLSNTATPAIYGLSSTFTMANRVNANNDITYTGSTTITFTDAFKDTPSIGISASLAEGDRYVISGQSRTGFTMTTYTGGTVSSNPLTFDYVAQGYGKEIT